VPTVSVNPFLVQSTSANSAKDGNGSRAQLNQKSPNT
jgi:hypothetical protein